MTVRRPARTTHHGQVMVLFALCAMVVLGVASFAIDGGLQLYQLRMTQNAVDSASVGAAQALTASCGASPPTAVNSAIWNVASDVTSGTAPHLSSFSGYYLDAQGATLMVNGSRVPLVGGADPNGSALVPAGACGVEIQATSSWNAMISKLIGFQTLAVVAHAGAVVQPSNSAISSPLGVMALATSGEHTIYAAGDGAFTVNGSVFDNVASNSVSTECYRPGVDPDGNGDDDTSPLHDPDQDGTWDHHDPTHAPCGPGQIMLNYTDAIDSKETSRFVVTGTMVSVANSPTDRNVGTMYPPPTTPNNVAGQTGLVPYDPSLPAYVTRLAAGGVIAYGNSAMLNPNQQSGSPPLTAGQVITNPLTDAYGVAPNASSLGCGGGPLPIFTAPPGPLATTGPFAPGVYTFPVDVTGNPLAGPAAPTFLDCPGGQPGVYIFEQGVYIHPTNPAAVFGTDVLFVTQNPVSDSVLPNNVGTGAPLGAVDKSGTPVGPGLNLSIAIGGTGSVKLTGPNSGPYQGVLLWQAHTDYAGNAARANFGFNTSAGDLATIDLTGLLGNTTMGQVPGQPGITDAAARYYPRPADATPYDQGGILISGLPDVGGTQPSTPQGTTTITGSTIVDTFVTQGDTATTINAVQSKVANSGSASGARLVN